MKHGETGCGLEEGHPPYVAGGTVRRDPGTSETEGNKSVMHPGEHSGSKSEPCKEAQRLVDEIPIGTLLQYFK